MVVTSKSINVDFGPGEHIRTAIGDALDLAAFAGVPVKFKFNGVPMTVKPPAWTFVGLKCVGRPRKYWGKMADIDVDRYYDEFNAKWNKREAKANKKLFGGK